MPGTAVALLKNPALVERVVKDIENLGIPKTEVRTLEEPATFPVTGVMSFTRLDFEDELRRELLRIGATKSQVEDYIQGVQRGDILVLASGPDREVKEAAAIMNRQGAADVEKSKGPEPELAALDLNAIAPISETSVQADRSSEGGSGARLFVW
jgi:hypothetical protein